MNYFIIIKINDRLYNLSEHQRQGNTNFSLSKTVTSESADHSFINMTYVLGVLK